MAKSRETEVRRILDRYLIEVVEAYDLCPWARSARTNGEVAVEIVWGSPSTEEWIAATRRALAMPKARVAMIVAPEVEIDVGDLRAMRDAITVAIGGIGVAEFHPRATLDLASPARLVRFLRRAPDPLLQIVPLSLLQSVRGAPAAIDRADQVKMLGGLAPPVRGDVADMIALENHTTVSAHHAAIVATLESIAADRATAYAAVGIGTVPYWQCIATSVNASK